MGIKRAKDDNSNNERRGTREDRRTTRGGYEEREKGKEERKTDRKRPIFFVDETEWLPGWKKGCPHSHLCLFLDFLLRGREVGLALKLGDLLPLALVLAQHGVSDFWNLPTNT